MARSKQRLPDTERELRVARWLAELGIPAVRPLDVPQPIEADGRIVTLWESANDEEEYGPTAELGSILRELHSLQASPGLDLPKLAVFDRSVERIDTVPGISNEDRTFLLARAEHLSSAYDELAFDLPPGVIHGDANVGNLLRDRHGQPLLMDLESFAIGPREWDLIQTAIFYDRFGWHTESEYEDFVRAYDYDIREWAGYRTLREARELSMVSWLMQNVRSDAKAAAEFDKRMQTLRSDGSAHDWSPL